MPCPRSDRRRCFQCRAEPIRLRPASRRHLLRRPPHKRVQRASGVYELTWPKGSGPAGRAT
ncbi:hypothetical protein FMM49_01175 (plasmid) [Streptomyces rimosus subsp. rimosus]|nr:hypothetical protein CTZ40_42200 [Streptomyces rimosus]QTL84589.1 hypothetical protein FMM49_01175 [Streptomyces rimosus subsp. rimosus]